MSSSSLSPSSLLVYYDTETTGLDTDVCEITELAACISGSHWWSCLVKPSKPIPEEVTKFNGISDATVADAGSFQDCIPNFFLWLDQHRSGLSVVLVAHNNFGFDELIVRRQCKESAIEIPSWVRFADTLPVFRVWLPSVRSYTLAALAKKLKIEGTQTHRARGDVEMLMRVVDKCPNKEGVLEELLKSGH
jgi:DNA polymerase III alpha subunit (gram-positive type)